MKRKLLYCGVSNGSYSMCHYCSHVMIRYDTSTKGGFRLTRLMLERQSKNSASTIFSQLVVNR